MPVACRARTVPNTVVEVWLPWASRPRIGKVLAITKSVAAASA